ncbi:hypothetical protein WA026_001458 [Henosepilachna vigintioctopunctata]|uniref:Uncharacterized protein n=1 Tax=Henosepilachna vigintioctopunctata TaxID=420089 RepID=A0AAW1UPZ9_9CUCU
MGSSNSKKPEITIKSIRMSTEDIRSSLRRKRPPLSKEDLHQTLISNSKQLETLRPKQSKKKQLEINQLQKLVSDVSEELLEYNDEHLDKSTDESHSFIHIEPDQLKKQKKNLKCIKTPTPKLKSSNYLDDIERELSRVKSDVSVGIKNEDNKFILLQKKKIEMLSTDLEMLNIQKRRQFTIRSNNWKRTFTDITKRL